MLKRILKKLGYVKKEELENLKKKTEEQEKVIIWLVKETHFIYQNPLEETKDYILTRKERRYR